MAELTGKAISELPAATTIGDSDLLALSQSGASKKITPPILLTGVMKSRSSITTAPSSVDEIMSYLQGVYRVGISVSQSIFPANYGLLEIIISDVYGLARFTQVNTSTSKIWTRSWNRNDNTWYETAWINVVGADTTITNTIANVVTPASGCTISSVQYAQYGKIAMLNLILQKNTAVSSGSTVVATIVSGKRPAIRAIAEVLNNSIYAASVGTNGEVLLSGAITAGSNLQILATYVLP